MVVLLIMGILLAIAIPTFLGVAGGAKDRAAQSNLNTALTNAKAYYGNNNQTYGTTASAASGLASSEPDLTFTTGAPGAGNSIAVGTTTGGNGLMLTAYSANGNCWGVFTYETQWPTTQPAIGGTSLPTAVNHSGTWYVLFNKGSATTSNCTVANGLAASGPTWSSAAFPAG
jgi:type IV pilus assembly protein PilA